MTFKSRDTGLSINDIVRLDSFDAKINSQQTCCQEGARTRRKVKIPKFQR